MIPKRHEFVAPVLTVMSEVPATTPVFFEQAVVKLLVAMGYGGADGQAKVTQPVQRRRHRWHHQSRHSRPQSGWSDHLRPTGRVA